MEQLSFSLDNPDDRGRIEEGSAGAGGAQSGWAEDTEVPAQLVPVCLRDRAMELRSMMERFVTWSKTPRWAEEMLDTLDYLLEEWCDCSHQRSEGTGGKSRSDVAPHEEGAKMTAEDWELWLDG